MTRPGRVVLWCAAVLAASLRAETIYPVSTEPASGVNLHLATPLTALPVFGYFPLHLRVENGSAEAGVWQLNFQVGPRNGFPGRLDSSLSISVAAGQNRDTWIYVALAEAGVIYNNPGTPVSSRATVPTVPPATPGIYPGPEGAKTSFRISQTSSSAATVELVRSSGSPQRRLSSMPA